MCAVLQTRQGYSVTYNAFLHQLADEAVQHIVKWLERGAWPDLYNLKIRTMPIMTTAPPLAAALKRRHMQMVSLPPYWTEDDRCWRADHKTPYDYEEQSDEDEEIDWIDNA